MSGAKRIRFTHHHRTDLMDQWRGFYHSYLYGNRLCVTLFARSSNCSIWLLDLLSQPVGITKLIKAISSIISDRIKSSPQQQQRLVQSSDTYTHRLFCDEQSTASTPPPGRIDLMVTVALTTQKREIYSMWTKDHRICVGCDGGIGIQLYASNQGKFPYSDLGKLNDLIANVLSHIDEWWWGILWKNNSKITKKKDFF